MQRRLRLPGLDARRADLIVAGAVLLDTVVRLLGAEEVTLSDLALREGLVLDYIDRNRTRIATHRPLSPTSAGGASSNSANAAAGTATTPSRSRGWRCRCSTRRAACTGSATARASGSSTPALLHDIGGHISYMGHHKHSYYLIRNGGLRGFEPEEVEAIALMARYHRRGRPEEVESRARRRCPPAARRAVRVGAALLRLAESLDRSHGQVVEQVELQARGDRYRLRAPRARPGGTRAVGGRAAGRAAGEAARQDRRDSRP